MDATPLNLTFNLPNFVPNPGAKTLVVVLHALGQTSERMGDLIEVVKKYSVGQPVDVYRPTLPYSSFFDSTGAQRIVIGLVNDLDAIWNIRPPGEQYERVIFIGYSLGGLLLRRLFLAGTENPPDYDANFGYRDDFPDGFRHARDWAKKVDRIILLATWEKGWSVSARTSWFYSIWLNLLGAIERILELVLVPLFGKLSFKPAKTMLDMRRGAPFIVQSRLLWMAYRRWFNSNESRVYNEKVDQKGLPDARKLLRRPPEDLTNPLVIQIIGTKDDFVSPQDQIDLDVEGIRAWFVGEKDQAAREGANERKDARNYYVLEMPGADHTEVVNFNGEIGGFRKKVFITALTETPEELQERFQSPDTPECPNFVRNPVNFLDTPPIVNTDVTDLVFVIHGIRDDGYWTHRVAAAIKRVWENNRRINPDETRSELYPAWTHTYGYFPMGAFILPWIRKNKVEWFMDNYVTVKALYPNATLHYVGHSNGTYLAAAALNDYPATRFGNVYFAGSVVNPEFDWNGMKKCGRVKRFHNARGGEDWVVAFLPKSLEYFTDLGGAGFDGFEQIQYKNETIVGHDPELTQSRKYAKGGHSGAITEMHWQEIAEFIVNSKPPSSETSDLFADAQYKPYEVIARFRVVIPLVVLAVGIILIFVCSYWLPSYGWNLTLLRWFGGIALYGWVAALVGFLCIQYTSITPPRRTPLAISRILMLLCAIPAIVWLVMSIYSTADAYAHLDAAKYTRATEYSSFATLTFIVLLTLISFVLTRL
jgi:pimeloyl-ACP methyl ester carboxylesterase